MEKPVIGVTPTVIDGPKGEKHVRYSVHRDYIDRIAEAGGVPIVIPPGTEAGSVARIIDGWLITGGDDIDASHWGEQNHPSVELESRNRTETEARLWQEADGSMPVLGICYGCQLVNVFLGGSLVQHLPDVVGDDKHRGNHVHQVPVLSGSKLAGIVGESARGASSHHQAVGTLGEGLREAARHEDGTIEAIEGTGERWLFGVQWHPERTHVAETERLFREFVRAASEFRASRRK